MVELVWTVPSSDKLVPPSGFEDTVSSAENALSAAPDMEQSLIPYIASLICHILVEIAFLLP